MPKNATKNERSAGTRSAMRASGISDGSFVTVGTITDPSAMPIGLASEDRELAIALNGAEVRSFNSECECM